MLLLAGLIVFLSCARSVSARNNQPYRTYLATTDDGIDVSSWEVICETKVATERPGFFCTSSNPIRQFCSCMLEGCDHVTRQSSALSRGLTWRATHDASNPCLSLNNPLTSSSDFPPIRYRRLISGRTSFQFFAMVSSCCLADERRLNILKISAEGCWNASVDHKFQPRGGRDKPSVDAGNRKLLSSRVDAGDVRHLSGG